MIEVLAKYNMNQDDCLQSLKIIYIFRTVLRLQKNWEDDTEISIIPVASTQEDPSPLSTFPTRAVHLE